MISALVPLVIFAAGAFAQERSAGPEPLYLIFDQGHFGLIDASGKTVLPPRFDAIDRWPRGDSWSIPLSDRAEAEVLSAGDHPVRDSVIRVRLEGKAALATRDGRVLERGRYEWISGSLQEGRIPVHTRKRYGFADERGELVIPAEFDWAGDFKGGFAFVQVGGRWGVIDRDGGKVVPPTWDEVDQVSRALGDPWVKVRIGQRWGVVERSGRVVIPVRFEDIRRPLPPLIAAVDSGQTMYLRPDGTTAFQFKCPTGKAQGFPFLAKNAAIVGCDERWGLIDTLGNFLLEPTWDHINPFQEGRALVKSGGETGVIDSLGHFVLKPGEFEIVSYSYREGMALFRGPDSTVGFIDRDGRIAIPPSFEAATEFYEGLAAAWSGGKAGYVNHTGAWVIEPRFWVAHPFHGPLATVEMPVTKDAKELAYIDRAGNIVYRMRFSGYAFPDSLLREFR